MFVLVSPSLSRLSGKPNWRLSVIKIALLTSVLFPDRHRWTPMNQERLGFVGAYLKAGYFRPRVYPAKLRRGRPNPSRWKDKLKFGVRRGTYCFLTDTDKRRRSASVGPRDNRRIPSSAIWRSKLNSDRDVSSTCAASACTCSLQVRPTEVLKLRIH